MERIRRMRAGSTRRSGRVGAAARRWVVLVGVLALASCDVLPLISSPPRDVGDQVPIAVLSVNGTYLDGELEVRDLGWRVGLRSIDPDGADGPDGGSDDDDDDGDDGGVAGTTAHPDPVTARLLDADGHVIAEQRATVAGDEGDGREVGDIAEPGLFGFRLGVPEPSTVVTLQVEAGGQRYEEHAETTVAVALGDVPATVRTAIDLPLRVDDEPRDVTVALHNGSVSGRRLPVHGGTFHLDPTRYGRGVAHVVALATDGLAADLAHARTEIDVEFEEHLEIHLDHDALPIRVDAGRPYLTLDVTVAHYTAPNEARTEHPPPWTVTFTSDVDGPLDSLNLSAGHPELYVEVSDLSPGAHVVTVRAEGEAMAVERPVEIHIER